MADTFKCPHCGALYEIAYEKIVSDDKHAADSSLRETNGLHKRLKHSVLRTRQDARWYECLIVSYNI
jgi:hypothetical protein